MKRVSEGPPWKRSGAAPHGCSAA